MMTDVKLNPTVAAYVEESNAGNVDALAARFTDDAVVADEGQTHRGIEEIRRWLVKTREEYHFKLEPLDVADEGGEIIVTCLVSGTFPGSPIRIRFFFTLEGDKIAALTSRV